MVTTSRTHLQCRRRCDCVATWARAPCDYDHRDGRHSGYCGDTLRGIVRHQSGERSHDHPSDGHRSGRRHRVEMAMDKHLIGPPYRTSSRVRAKSG